MQRTRSKINGMQGKVAARRVWALPFEINQLACPTAGFTPIDIQRESRGLSNRFSVLSARQIALFTRCQKRKSAEGTGIHLDGIQSLDIFKSYSVRPVCARFAEMAR